MKYIKKYNENIEWNWVQEENDDSIPDDFKGYEDFYYFLIKNNILDNYIENIYNDSEFIKYKTLSKFFSSFYKDIFINQAFNWSITPEGHKFWSYYNDLWLLLTSDQ
jgi:hypothetical protein